MTLQNYINVIICYFSRSDDSISKNVSTNSSLDNEDDNEDDDDTMTMFYDDTMQVETKLVPDSGGWSSSAVHIIQYLS